MNARVHQPVHTAQHAPPTTPPRSTDASSALPWPAKNRPTCASSAAASGVNTALELAQRGFSVVLLEAHQIGWGASGRNGGQLIRGVGHDVEQFLPVIGADGVKALKLMGLEAVEIVRRRVEQYAIDCDLRWGYCDLANKPGDYQGFREDMEEPRPSAIATRCAWCRPRRCAA